MIILIAAGVALLILVVIVVGIADAAQAASWQKIAAERRARWEARQVVLHGADIYGELRRHDADTFARLQVNLAEVLASEPATGMPDTHATGMNDATDDVNDVLNFMGPPPTWSGKTNAPIYPTPAGLS